VGVRVPPGLLQSILKTITDLSLYLKIDGVKISSDSLRKKLIQQGLKNLRCENCLNTHWLGKPISLELHHINGVKKDNRLDNLQILCPNCHAQTEHYRGRKKRKKVVCVDCNRKISNKSTYCRSCSMKRRAKRSPINLDHLRRCVWPTKEELQEDLVTLPYTAIGRKYGVTDNSVRRWARKYGLL
jgi:Zn finger protein HypA/HybF involved in hydrogenase expression